MMKHLEDYTSSPDTVTQYLLLDIHDNLDDLHRQFQVLLLCWSSTAGRLSVAWSCAVAPSWFSVCGLVAVWRAGWCCLWQVAPTGCGEVGWHDAGCSSRTRCRAAASCCRGGWRYRRAGPRARTARVVPHRCHKSQTRCSDSERRCRCCSCPSGRESAMLSCP